MALKFAQSREHVLRWRSRMTFHTLVLSACARRLILFTFHPCLGALQAASQPLLGCRYAVRGSYVPIATPRGGTQSGRSATGIQPPYLLKQRRYMEPRRRPGF
jgi:hypothetical protein